MADQLTNPSFGVVTISIFKIVFIKPRVFGGGLGTRVANIELLFAY